LIDLFLYPYYSIPYMGVNHMYGPFGRLVPADDLFPEIVVRHVENSPPGSD